MQNRAQKKYMRFTGVNGKKELENENENENENRKKNSDRGCSAEFVGSIIDLSNQET